MKKVIEVNVRPKFLMITNDAGYVETTEFDDEKSLRTACLNALDHGMKVTCYKVNSRSEASRHHALDMRWK